MDFMSSFGGPNSGISALMGRSDTMASTQQQFQATDQSVGIAGSISMGDLGTARLALGGLGGMVVLLVALYFWTKEHQV